MEESCTIRRLGPGDEQLVFSAAHLFDNPPIPDQTALFLAGQDTMLWLAFVEEVVAGFVSAIVLRHPDKRPSLFVDELGVDEAFRRRGIAAALMEETICEGRASGCEAVWVAAEADDAPAIAFYESLSGKTARMARVFEWEGGD